MKTIYYRLSAFCAASLILTTTIAPAAFAVSTANTDKEEVVYANISTDGSVKNIDVVNIFDLNEASTITDYGSYSSTRNMTTTYNIKQDDDLINVTTDKAAKIYYEGRLANNNLPWNISIRYYLNSKEVSADEIAGQSGEIKVTLRITRNTNYAGADFYKNYALQSSIELDTNKFTNIKSDDATITNVGESKKLTYIALPNKGANYTITASTTDFAIDGFSINAIPLTLNIDVDDTVLLNKVTELTNAISSVDNGANSLNSGADTLNTGIEKLENYLTQLNDNSGTLTSGSAQVLATLNALKLQVAGFDAEGLQQLSSASNRINDSIAEISDNIAKLNAATEQLAKLNTLADSMTQVKTKNSTLIQKYQQAIAQIDTQIAAAQTVVDDSESSTEIINQYKQIISDLADEKANLQQVVNLLQANNSIIEKTSPALSQASNLANAIKQLNDGTQKLKESYNSFNNALQGIIKKLYQLALMAENIDALVAQYSMFNDGVNDYTDAVAQIVAGYSTLANGSTSLAQGSSKLASGTTKLKNATSGLDTNISKQIDDLLASIQGNAHIGSFVSAKNTNVNAVQFVINTDAVVKAETTTTETVTDNTETSLWDRILNLFR